MGTKKAKKPVKQKPAPALLEHAVLIPNEALPVVDEALAGIFAIIDRAEKGQASPHDFQRLRETVTTNALIQAQIQAKNATIKRLRDMLFGFKSEKTSQVCPTKGMESGMDEDSLQKEAGQATQGKEKGENSEQIGEEAKEKKKRKGGKGRRPAGSLPASEVTQVSHPTLKAGDECPECPYGRLYPLKPRVLVRITAMSPLFVSRTELAKLRCNSCGEIFTAPAPENLDETKYDASVASMMAMLRYGTGLPFNRFNAFQSAFGMSMPVSTQWGLVAKSYDLLTPVLEHLMDLAAQGDVIYQDDTMMKILDRRDLLKTDPKRKAIQTSGLVSQVGRHRIALFLTGHNHAGENLKELLKRRNELLGRPIQMCDALAANTKGDMATILAHCLAHARRKFVEVVEDFPEECRHLLETLKDVYGNDAKTKGMSPPDRLSYHKEHSGPLMKDLHAWLKKQVEECLVEPNSGLGKAIAYTLNHWEALTLFLREPGAPLDNNVAERSLKRAILHRKNSLFYKTQRGAKVGDLFMSLIHTAELNGIKPFPYLVILQRYHALAEENPEEWLPWNYQETLDSLPA